MKRETQKQRWSYIENYILAINACMQNAADDHDKERLQQLEYDKNKWLKDNFVISRPSLKNRKLTIFNK